MDGFQLNFAYDPNWLIAITPALNHYRTLFSVLDLTKIRDQKARRGRPAYPRRAILRAFIVKHQERINSVPRLVAFLHLNPILAQLCGFVDGIPEETVFYRFLHETPPDILDQLHIHANRELIDKKVITTDQLAIDSKPVMAATKHNNPKNSKRSRNKDKKIRRNPDATLGYYSYTEKSDGTKRTEFFWGYRTHCIVTSQGICLVQLTLRNNITDAKVAKRLIRKLKRLYKVKKGSIFLADSAYDEKALYDLIVNGLKCQAFIRLNPRGSEPPKTLGPHGRPLCDAALEMGFSCTCTEHGRIERIRHKFRCPFKTKERHQLLEQYPDGCPAKKPCFTEGAAYGCTQYIDVTDDPRHRIDRSSPQFEEKIKERQVVEQYFSRLGDREAEQTNHYRLRTVRNQMTIAHLTLSLVALAAVQIGRPEKIRCYSTFAKAG